MDCLSKPPRLVVLMHGSACLSACLVSALCLLWCCCCSLLGMSRFQLIKLRRLVMYQDSTNSNRVSKGGREARSPTHWIARALFLTHPACCLNRHARAQLTDKQWEASVRA